MSIEPGYYSVNIAIEGFWHNSPAGASDRRFRCGCQIRKYSLFSLLELIWHLNDEHKRTFLQIADHLEREEERLGVRIIMAGDDGRWRPYIERYNNEI